MTGPTGPTPGQVLNGRYELRRRIGGGSMGEVWRGRDLMLGRTVAIKIVLPALLETPTFRERFVAEARVMAMLDHPGIVGVYDYGYADGDDPGAAGAAFLVMEFIEGESLDKVLARTGPLEPRFALKVLASLLDALAAVHRAGVVHRDVKPANVMLTSGGVVLADFGIARSAESLGLTAADALMGTVPYLAPELFQAETPTPAADVYAVGILGYELLSGRQPFQAASTAAVMYKHMHEPPPPLPDYVAAPAAEVLWHALEKDATRRWTDGAEMAAAVRHVLEGAVEVGETVGAAADFARPHAGNLSGYEDTLTDSGGRRRRPSAAAVAAGAAAVEGFDELSDSGGRYGRQEYDDQLASAADLFEESFGEPLHSEGTGGRRARSSFEDGYGEAQYADGAAEAAGRRGRSSFEDGYGDPLDISDPLSDSGGRHGRAAAFGEAAASDSGGRRGRSGFDETTILDTSGAQVSDSAQTSRMAAVSPYSDSGGRRGRHADAPDATRVMAADYDADSGGRHAGEVPLRRRGAESGTPPGAEPSNGRGASPASRTDPARRRALVTAAVAAPALLGLTVALVMNSSGGKPSSGPGPGSGSTQPADVPTRYGASQTDEPQTPSATSSSYYQRPTRGHSGGSQSGSATPTQTGTGTRSASAPYSSVTAPSTTPTSTSDRPSTSPTSVRSSSAGSPTSSPTSTTPTSPASSSSSP